MPERTTKTTTGTGAARRAPPPAEFNRKVMLWMADEQLAKLDSVLDRLVAVGQGLSRAAAIRQAIDEWLRSRGA